MDYSIYIGKDSLEVPALPPMAVITQWMNSSTVISEDKQMMSSLHRLVKVAFNDDGVSDDYKQALHRAIGVVYFVYNSTLWQPSQYPYLVMTLFLYHF